MMAGMGAALLHDDRANSARGRPHCNSGGELAVQTSPVADVKRTLACRHERSGPLSIPRHTRPQLLPPRLEAHPRLAPEQPRQRARRGTRHIGERLQVLAGFGVVTLGCALAFPDRREEPRPKLWAEVGGGTGSVVATE